MKNFAIFRNTNKQSDNEPDYRISAKIGDNYEEIGAGWTKEGKSGKFISCQLRKSYKDKKGLIISEEQEEINPDDIDI